MNIQDRLKQMSSDQLTEVGEEISELVTECQVTGVVAEICTDLLEMISKEFLRRTVKGNEELVDALWAETSTN